jgi:hypothetical protein
MSSASVLTFLPLLIAISSLNSILDSYLPDSQIGSHLTPSSYRSPLHYMHIKNTLFLSTLLLDI